MWIFVPMIGNLTAEQRTPRPRPAVQPIHAEVFGKD